MLVGTEQKLATVTNFCVIVREFTNRDVMLDSSLSWNDHVDAIAAKISSRLGLLRKARGLYHFYDTMILV